MPAPGNTPAATDPIGIIGLGYVGLPLAVEFGKTRPVIGFDTNPVRVAELHRHYDRTDETTADELRQSRCLSVTDRADDLAGCRIFIVTVPTPIDVHKQPDLGPLLAASVTVGQLLKPGDLVIYESTVYPGCTEEDCVPVLERESGLRLNDGFTVGYSPERINPGDRQHTLTRVRKVTAGSTPAAADRVDALYASIIGAGTHRVASIQIAEAAKVIENCQRDINIAFVNELALIFDRMGLDTAAVLEAAGTKWNFLPFQPGLVGGHCIGVDPYYLTYKAQSLGYNPQMILSGRRINDNMGIFVANKVVKLLIQHHRPVNQARVLVLGVTFKENCSDIRNSQVIGMVEELAEFGVQTDIYDPNADPDELRRSHGLSLLPVWPADRQYDAMVLAVAHRQFLEPDFVARLGRQSALIYDVKRCLPAALVSGRL